MQRLKMGDRMLGNDCVPFIIAEAGINHNGDIELAKKMIISAKKAGADAVKFQTFRTEEFIQDKTEMYTYKSQGIEVTESQYEMFKRTEFMPDEWREIKLFCDGQGIMFLSTPVSVEDAKFLIDLGVDALKVGSDDFTNIPLLHQYQRLGLPLIISSGMATEEEICKSLKAVGADEGYPVCLMLCTSQYPTPPEDVNARKLLSMSEKFPEVLLGFSDHTQGATAAIVATSLGARVFEKHFTLDHNLPGPDHWFSSNPDELKEWVESIRRAWIMLGNKELKPTKGEEAQRNIMHRSITAIKDIEEGEIFTEENIALLRPGNGISPYEWGNILGKRSVKNIKQGTQLTFDVIGD